MSIGVYLVTDRAQCGARGVAETVRVAVDNGVRFVQIRDKTSPDAELMAEIERVASLIDGNARLLINDRVDLAAAARHRGIPVDGAHIGQGDTDPRRTRELLGPDAIIGLTANTRAHLDALAALPEGTIDYLGVGVIRATRTKPDHPEPLGIDGFAAFTARSPLPTVAIGGVVARDLPALRAAGASGAAVVSAICAAADPALATRELVAAWGA